MIKTINDLLNYYNIPVNDVPKYVLEYEFEDETENYGEHHTEEQDGRTIHVFTSENDADGKHIKIENILDLEQASWTELVYVDDKTPTYHQITFNEEYEMESYD